MEMYYHLNMQRKERIRFIIASVINVAIFGIMVYCLVTLINSYINGKNRFIYFTNISNLIVGLMSLINAVFLILSVVKNKNCVPQAFTLIKIIAISMTTLTFFTVLLVIGSVDGYIENYSGRNFFTHLIVPLLTLFSYFFFEEKLELKWKYSLCLLMPFVIYSIVYVINVVFLQTWPDLYQINKQGLWYFFLIAFLVADFSLGQGIYFLKRFIDKKRLTVSHK